MAQLNPDNVFQSWTLTQQEELHGSVLTSLQKQCIQNQLAALATEKLLLKYTPEQHLQFLQREAELQGQIGAYQYLLVKSTEAEKLLQQHPDLFSLAG